MDTNDLLRAIRNLLPAIRARRHEIEQARCMPRDLIEELRKTGMFSLSVPRVIGGKEAKPVDIMRAIEAVATADGSTGWCAMIATGNNVAAGYMTESGAKEVFADPTAPSAGIAAPAGKAVRVDGGVRVSGRWPFASGITHCEWVWAGCMVMEDGRAADDSSGSRDSARMHASERGPDPRHLVREWVVRNRQQRLQRRRHLRP